MVIMEIKQEETEKPNFEGKKEKKL